LLIYSMIAAIPHTEPWGPNTALVMIICNAFAIAITVAISKSTDRAQPNSSLSARSDLVKNFNSATLLAGMSLGHILGVGMLLGLTNIGII
jgi:photosystem I subunit X